MLEPAGRALRTQLSLAQYDEKQSVLLVTRFFDSVTEDFYLYRCVVVLV